LVALGYLVLSQRRGDVGQASHALSPGRAELRY
jgi:hypothetical protein